MEKHVFNLMGVEIFRWSEYDPVDDTTDQYYDVEFILPELS